MSKINTEEMLNVADFFSEMHDKGGKVNIAKTHSTAGINECDTPACIGGWLSVYYDTEIDRCFGRCFDDGADIFAQKSGFEYMAKLEEWAGENKTLWGEHGIEMFYEGYAWIEDGGYNGEGELTLEHAAYKLRKVVGRVNEYQKLNKKQ